MYPFEAVCALNQNLHFRMLITGTFPYLLPPTEFSKVQQSFAQVLGNFQFQTIGAEQTEDEVMIGSVLPSPPLPSPPLSLVGISQQ